MTNQLTERLYDFRASQEISRHEELPYEAGVLGPEGTLQARRILAQKYVFTGTVDPADLAPDGTLGPDADPYYYRGQRTYYGVWDRNDPSKILITASLIHPDSRGVSSLQLHLEDIDQEYRAELEKRKPEEIAELTAYVKSSELVDPVQSRLCALYLIREIIKDSRDKGIRTWVFGLRPQLKSKYKRLFGPGLDKRGETVRLGTFKTPFLPYSVDVERAWRKLMDSSILRVGSRAMARFVGMSGARVKTSV
jgi:hypothetical protein